MCDHLQDLWFTDMKLIWLTGVFAAQTWKNANIFIL
jgi:hypothetical protein